MVKKKQQHLRLMWATLNAMNLLGTVLIIHRNDDDFRMVHDSSSIHIHIILNILYHY